MAKTTTLTPLETTMVDNYTRLIQRGLKNIKDVPTNLKAAVEAKLKTND